MHLAVIFMGIEERNRVENFKAVHFSGLFTRERHYGALLLFLFACLALSR